jgi:hypothetical protein
MTEWQPIETAPKDGTPVLVCWRGKHFHPIVGHCESDVWGYLNDDMSFSTFKLQPTDWTPLPTPAGVDDGEIAAPAKCAECDCQNPPDGCNWIKPTT